MDIQQDLHIHTIYSNCGKPSNTVRAIVQVAEQRSLLLIGLSDHIDEFEQHVRLIDIIKAHRKEVQAAPSQCRILVGTEATMISPTFCALPSTIAQTLDYVLVACNHYHLANVEKPKQHSPAAYARHHLAMIRGAAQLGFATIIAHPFLNDYCEPELARETIKKYPENDLIATLQVLAKYNVALEINPYRVVNHLEWFRDIIIEGRKKGVKFAIGSDSHSLERIGLPPVPIEHARVRITPAEVCTKLGLLASDLIWPFVSSSMAI